jgi:4-hydroxybenzoate polyprenyltransferase
LTPLDTAVEQGDEAGARRPRSRWLALAEAMRPHQWLKNLLVFVPALTGVRHFADATPWPAAIGAFVAFSAVASSVYLLNDIFDRRVDRAHPRKRLRPFASGELAIPFGLAASAVLMAGGAILAAAEGILAILALYAAISVVYSARLKTYPLTDVFVLAVLYMMRLFAGGIATGYQVSLWLLGFSAFLFFGLATMKRVEELRGLELRGERTAPGRGYTTDDRPILEIFGCCASFVSALMLALFVQSEASSALYRTLPLLWGAVPLILLWQCRLWLATANGRMHDDPILFTLRDPGSWIIVAAVGALFLAARWF